MKKLFLLFICLCQVAFAEFAYVANQADNTLTPIDLDTNTLGTPIPLNFIPTSTAGRVVVTPDGTKAYVSSSNSQIAVVDLITQQRTLILLGAVTQLRNLAITPDGSTVYSGTFSLNPGMIIPIDVATDRVVSPTASGFILSQGFGVTPDNKFLYVTSTSAALVNVFDITNPQTPVLVTTIIISSPSQNVVISPDGLEAYVSSLGAGGIIRISTVTNTVIGSTLLFAGVNTIAFTPDGSKAYATSTGGSVLPIDTATFTGGTPIVLGSQPLGIAISSDGTTAYVCKSLSNEVATIDIATNTVGVTITGFNFPDGIAIAPAPTPPPTSSPSVTGVCRSDKYATETDLVIVLTWRSATNSPVRYLIYRDAALTNLAGTVSASATREFFDHQRQPNTPYTYYVVAETSSGSQSLVGSTTVTCYCNCDCN